MGSRWMRVVVVVGVAALCRGIGGTWAEESPQAQNTPTSAATPAEGPVVYTFADQDELQQFSQLFVIKQNILTRLAVLQAYAGQEAANLEQINGQLFLKFKVDPNKNYTLDAEKRVLMERPASPAKPADAAASGASAPAASLTPAAPPKP